MKNKESSPKPGQMELETINFNQINWAGVSSSGGVTGSMRVNIRNESYQYKPPIIENSWIRRIKSNDLDSENFGEVLASRIAKAFDKDKDNARIPQVEFVVKNRSSEVAIASKYLKGRSVKSLNDYLDPKKSRRGSHVLLGNDSQQLPGYVNINKNADLKVELAAAIAISALVGDHDVNPGNMIVVTGDNNDVRVGRIDFGHAFNDMRRFPRFGGHQVHKNNIIDFFNRDTIDGPNKFKSKLWGSYPGLVPSREMAEALYDLSHQDGKEEKIRAAISSVKKEVRRIFEQNPNVDQRHVIQSFHRISEHVSGQKVDSKLHSDQQLEKIFNDIDEFMQLNLKQMAYAADVMMLQVEITEAVSKEDAHALSGLKQKYELLVQEKEMGPFSWFKESDDQPPFTGNFDALVAKQKRALIVTKLTSELEQLEDLKDPSIVRFRNSLLVNLTDTRLSVERKLYRCNEVIGDWEKQPEKQSSIFQEFLTAIKTIFAALGFIERAEPARQASPPSEEETKVMSKLKSLSISSENHFGDKEESQQETPKP